MSVEIAIIGDNFMQAAAFKEALESTIEQETLFHCMDLPFPDDPIIQSSSDPALSGVREFQGSPSDVIALAGSAQILITHVAPITAEVINALSRLELLAVSRGGPVNVDLNSAKQNNIKIVNTPGRNASAVAEFTIGALIAETRNISRGHADLMRGIWRGDLYRADVQRDELSTMTIGIIGYAEIGVKVATLLKAFGSRILVSDPFITLSEEDIAYGVEQVELDTLLQQSDAVTLHARVSEQTTNMIDARALAMMKPGAVLVNTARGPLLDYDALYDALASKHLSGAMLETFIEEPVPADSKLLTLQNVTLTPHIAGASKTTVKKAANMVAREVKLHLAGLPPNNPCNL